MCGVIDERNKHVLYGQIDSLPQGQKKGRCVTFMGLKGRCKHCKQKLYHGWANNHQTRDAGLSLVR
ncbi:hypothetical protein Lal_00000047 [Lupinus albus]|nr:hypothetical protein Lal_00000047 [Lupinus albus]